MAEPIDPAVWRRTIRGRLLVVTVAFAVWAAAIEARLVYLQVVDNQDLVAEGQKQQMRLVDAPGRRGDLVDRHGRLLAYSVDADSIYAVPSRLKSIPAAVATLCRALDGCSPTETRVLGERFRRQRAFAWVRRRVTVEQARRVMALELAGVGLMKEPRRYYPNRELAAPVLGYVGLDDQGLGGLEAAFDRQVRGRSGKLLVQKDSKGNAFSRVGDPPVPGASLELTIDEYLQHLAERELKAGIAENQAIGGSVVIMDPASGEILAMANAPSFNPNAYGQVDAERRRNRAAQDVYEPGSTFKMVTATAAIEEKVVSPETMIDTGDGVLAMGSRVVRDTHAHGTISFTDVIVLSSNVGAIKVGWRLGSDLLNRYVQRFGFGTRLCPDLPGENAGIVWPVREWKPNGALASISMGYQIGVTPLQMAVAASAVANGGELLQPRVVRAVIEGNQRTVVPRRVLRRVMSPQTAATLTTMMEEVVARGTAKTAQVPGFTIAGKTGTAAKLVNHRYSDSDYNASFAGFVPSRQPQLTIIVVIDRPHAKSHYGGIVAGPVFQRIAAQALRYLGVPPTINPLAPVLANRDQGREVRVAGPVRPLTILQPAPVQSADAQVLPELRGLGVREALRILARIGVSARVSGDGVVLEQEPPAGSAIEPGTSCRLGLGRVVPRQADEGEPQP